MCFPILFIMGPSASGKTCLLNALMNNIVGFRSLNLDENESRSEQAFQEVCREWHSFCRGKAAFAPVVESLRRVAQSSEQSCLVVSCPSHYYPGSDFIKANNTQSGLKFIILHGSPDQFRDAFRNRVRQDTHSLMSRWTNECLDAHWDAHNIQGGHNAFYFGSDHKDLWVEAFNGENTRRDIADIVKEVVALLKEQDH